MSGTSPGIRVLGSVSAALCGADPKGAQAVLINDSLKGSIDYFTFTPDPLPENEKEITFHGTALPLSLISFQLSSTSPSLKGLYQL